jgi:hypothetical protein
MQEIDENVSGKKLALENNFLVQMNKESSNKSNFQKSNRSSSIENS